MGCRFFIAVRNPKKMRQGGPKEHLGILQKMTECGICIESFNKTKRTHVVCPYCPTDGSATACCRSCVQTYLLQDDAQTPRCPSCLSGWTEDFLSDTFPKTWLLKEYKNHRERVLLDTERARLPEAQEDAARYKRALEIVRRIDEQTAPFEEQLKNLPEVLEQKRLLKEYFRVQQERFAIEKANGWERNQVARDAESLAWQAHRRASDVLYVATAPIHVQINRLHTSDYRKARQILTRVGAEPAARTAGQGQEVPKSAWTFVMKCSQPACEGFVGTNWKCGLCEAKFCKDCTEQEAEGHLCDPDRKATAEALRKEAKPCPKCAAMISKIDGCDQMWCTQCQTAFSWRTGQIETSHVHNPHYFQWMRSNGGVAPPRPDGECLQPDDVLEQAAYYLRSDRDLLAWCRTVRHYRWEVRHQRRSLQEKQNDDWRRVLRVQRLMNEITDEEWKCKLQKGEKATQKTFRVVEVLEMFGQVGIDFLREAMLETSDKAAVKKQFEDLQTYCNDAFARINKRYNNQVPYIALMNR